MNKRNAFRQALTEQKQRKHLRKSGKSWLVRSVTAMTVGLMLAQPVITVATVVDADPQTEAVAEDPSAQAEEQLETEETPVAPAQPEQSIDSETTTTETPVVTAPAAEPTPAKEITTKSQGQPQSSDTESVKVTAQEEKTLLVSGKIRDLTYQPGQSYKFLSFYLDITINDETISVPIDTAKIELHIDGVNTNPQSDIVPGKTHTIKLSTNAGVNSINRWLANNGYDFQVSDATVVTGLLTPAEAPEPVELLPLSARPNLPTPYQINAGDSFSWTFDGAQSGHSFSGEVINSDREQVTVENLKPGLHTLAFRVHEGDGDIGLYDYELTWHDILVLPAEEEIELGLQIGGQKQYDGTDALPANFTQFIGFGWPELAPTEFEHSTDGGATWTADAPSDVGDYLMRVKADTREAIQAHLEAFYGATLDDDAFVGHYQILAEWQIVEAGRLEIGGRKQYDGTRDLPADFVRLIEDLDIGYTLTEDDFVYVRLGVDDNNMYGGSPYKVGRYQMAVNGPARNAIQEYVYEEYGFYLDETDFFGEYEIYDDEGIAPQGRIALPEYKAYDGTDELPGAIDQDHYLEYDIEKHHLMYVRVSDETSLAPASRLLTAMDGELGTPTEPGTYRLALQQEYAAEFLAEHPDADASMFTQTYVIGPKSGDTDSGDTGSGNGSGGTTTDTGTGAGNTAGGTTSSLAYHPGESLATPATIALSMGSGGTDADSTLPSTGQRQQSALSMIGLALVGALGLTGWYQRRRRQD